MNNTKRVWEKHKITAKYLGKWNKFENFQKEKSGFDESLGTYMSS